MNPLIWLGIALLAAANALLMAHYGMALDISLFTKGGIWAFISGAWILILCAALALSHGRLHHDRNLSLFAHAMLQSLFIGPLLVIYSYATARFNFPLYDDTYIAIDRALGFDWLAHLRFVDQRAWLAGPLMFAYSSFIGQITLLLCIAFIYKQSLQAQRFIFLFLITGVVCVTLAAIFPAVAGYVYYNIDVATLNHMPPATRIHEAPLFAMRNHSENVIAFPLRGLVTFPSFHATAGVLLIYLAWPMRRLRLLIVPLNVLLIASVMYAGGHWLIDAIGGVVIALLGIGAISLFCHRPNFLFRKF